MNIYVGNLPFDATSTELRDLFAAYGAVNTAQVMSDRETNRSRGFGFVEMADATEAATAIRALSGSDFGGRALQVNEARPRGERPENGARGSAGYRPQARSGAYGGRRSF